jgi:hypothetical protein
MHSARISIWFFIGVLLVIYGVLILGSGLYELVSPPERTVVLGELHAPVWWGVLLLLIGAVYVRNYAPGKGSLHK